MYEPLPPSLESSRKDAMGPSTRAHLEYLWKAAHAVSSSSALAHHLARRFVETADKHGLHYPAEVTRRLCGWCSNILLPSVTCTVRIRPRGRHATRKVQTPAAVDKSKSRSSGSGSGMATANIPANQRFCKLKNTVVSHCSLCHHVTSVLAGYARTLKAPKNAKVADTTNVAVSESAATAGTAAPGASGVGNVPRACDTKFSFLKKLDKSAVGSLTGDFIPLGDNSSRRNSSSSSNSSSGGPSRGGQFSAAATSVGDKRSLTLAELERQSKKDKQKRRRSMPATPPQPAHRPGLSPPATTGGAGKPSLSSLQSFFKKK